MTGTTALIACLAVMVAVNAWVHLGPARWHPLTGPLAAAGLLALGRAAGLTWEQLGLGPGALTRGLLWGGAAAGVVVGVYAVGLALPATRGRFRDERHRIGGRRASLLALLAIPLGTVVFEEVAFRGVLWGLLAADHGTTWAIALTSVLFGAWHVLPAIDGARKNSPDGRVPRGVMVREVIGTVAFTAVAGLVFAVLRDRSDSLVSPALLHWATNGLGVLGAALAWRLLDDRD